MPPRARAEKTEPTGPSEEISFPENWKAGEPGLEEAHDPKRLVEKSDTKDEPVKTSGALPVEVPVVDSAPPAEQVMIDHPRYGRVSLVELEEIIKADLASEAAAKQAEEDAKLPELCAHC